MFWSWRWRSWHCSVQESRSENFKCLSWGSSHEGTVSSLRSKEQCELPVCHNIRQQQWDHFRTRRVCFGYLTKPKKASSLGSSHFCMERITGSASRYIYKNYLPSVAPLKKYFGGILSVVALNIVTGPGAPVAGSSKAFQPGHRRNLCSPAKYLHTHTHTFWHLQCKGILLMTESRRGREGKNSLHNASQKMYGMKTQIHPRNIRSD